jgi:hypothetical protein
MIRSFCVAEGRSVGVGFGKRSIRRASGQDARWPRWIQSRSWVSSRTPLSSARGGSALGVPNLGSAKLGKEPPVSQRSDLGTMTGDPPPERCVQHRTTSSHPADTGWLRPNWIPSLVRRIDCPLTVRRYYSVSQACNSLPHWGGRSTIFGRQRSANGALRTYREDSDG